MSGKIGRYEIIGELGSGGFATVFKAKDPTLDREVAIKVMRPMLMSDRGFVTRFEQEAKIVANLEHPNIVPIYDYGEFEGRLFLVMKMMSSTLANLLSGKRLPWKHVLELMKQVAAGLDYAHAHGLVHRDIKPENILIDDKTGTATLGDFGIVKALESSTVTMSMTGGILGTPAYTAPEVWNGEEVTAATDIYALACVVFEMVVGQKLFEGPTPPATMTLHFRPPQFPEQWPNAVPQEVGDVLSRALTRNPEERINKAGDFIGELSELSLDPLVGEYNRLRAAIAAKKWPEAVSHAEALLVKDLQYKDVAELLTRATEAQATEEQAAWATQWRQQAETALEAGEWHAATAAGQRWLQLAPEDQEAQAFPDKIVTSKSLVENEFEIAEWRQKAEAALAARQWAELGAAAKNWRDLAPHDLALRAFLREARETQATSDKSDEDPPKLEEHPLEQVHEPVLTEEKTAAPVDFVTSEPLPDQISKTHAEPIKKRSRIPGCLWKGAVAVIGGIVVLALIIWGLTSLFSPSPVEEVAPAQEAPAEEAAVVEAAPIEQIAQEGDTINRIMEAGIIRVGMHHEGYGFLSNLNNDGSYSGFEIDLIAEIVERIFSSSVSIKTTPLNANDRFAAVQSGEIDLLIRNSTHTTSREEFALWSLNYFLDGQRMMVRKDSGINNLEDLNGGAICVTEGTTTEVVLEAFLAEKGVEFEKVAFSATDETFKAYLAGRCDGVTFDWSLLIDLNEGNAENVVIGEIMTAVHDGSEFGLEPLAIAFPLGDEDLRDKVDEVLLEIIHDGSWQELYDEWLGDSLPWTTEEMVFAPAPKR